MTVRGAAKLLLIPSLSLSVSPFSFPLSPHSQSRLPLQVTQELQNKAVSAEIRELLKLLDEPHVKVRKQPAAIHPLLHSRTHTLKLLRVVLKEDAFYLYPNIFVKLKCTFTVLFGYISLTTFLNSFLCKPSSVRCLVSQNLPGLSVNAGKFRHPSKQSAKTCMQVQH